MKTNEVLEIRAQQLRRMAFVEGRRDELLALLCRYRGYPAGTFPAPGTLIVESILAHEFPAD